MARIVAGEDDPDLGLLLGQLLRQAGHDVEVVRTGALLLDAVHTTGPDLVVLDLSLPGHLDGLEVARSLRAADARLPILMLTARVTDADRERGLEAGADDYVAKPFDVDDLVARVDRLLTG